MAFLHIGISELPDDFHLSSFSNKEEVFNFVLVNGASCLVPLLTAACAGCLKGCLTGLQRNIYSHALPLWFAVGLFCLHPGLVPPMLDQPRSSSIVMRSRLPFLLLLPSHVTETRNDARKSGEVPKKSRRREEPR